jgi:hypothetical protein
VPIELISALVAAAVVAVGWYAAARQAVSDSIRGHRLTVYGRILSALDAIWIDAVRVMKKDLAPEFATIRRDHAESVYEEFTRARSEAWLVGSKALVATLDEVSLAMSKVKSRIGPEGMRSNDPYMDELARARTRFLVAARADISGELRPRLPKPRLRRSGVKAS